MYNMKIITSKSATVALSLALSTLQSGAHPSEPQQPFQRLHAHENLEFHIHTGWESRYFSEGRDALEGDSIWASSIELGLEHFTAGLWYGNSPDQSYDELQLSLGITESFGDLKAYIGYTHFIFPFEGSNDDEIGIGITWSGLPAEIELAAELYYSFEADGYFTEISANRGFEITENFSTSFSSIFGINQGYVTDGHDGANHFALQVSYEYVLTKSLSLLAHTTYSWEIGKKSTTPGDDLLKNFFHCGVGLQWAF